MVRFMFFSLKAAGRRLPAGSQKSFDRPGPEWGAEGDTPLEWIQKLNAAVARWCPERIGRNALPQAENST
jgi:hypothetical protein